MASLPQQRYQYFLVLDFEATCDTTPIQPQEIIEFPILKLNGQTMEIESIFHTYVQPVYNPQLTPFCTEEIIEFPILKLNGQTMEIESIFHTYVQPVYNPQLTPFCKELTGIIQSMVEGQPTLQQALQMVAEWMDKENLLNPDVSSVFVTCGDWDLRTM
ncbi:UNVERIFIED_CONTAM: hypothetical protein FKN15_042174 [Acipenser sinensis]